MEGFATGFAVESATTPGFFIENEEFKITFLGAICDESKNIISEGFESCYDWRPVMELFLQSTYEWDVPVDIEEKVETKLREWLTTFQGWGLLSSILPPLTHRYFILSLAFTSANWDTNSGGEYTEEKAFEAVKEVYQHVQDKDLASILPKFGIWFEENVKADKGAERRKNLTLFFNAKWVLELKFLVEKKRINRNLLELAAESVVHRIRFRDQVEQLEIPDTLLPVVRKKFKDVDWVRTYWSLRNHIEGPYSEEELENDFFGQPLAWPGEDFTVRNSSIPTRDMAQTPAGGDGSLNPTQEDEAHIPEHSEALVNYSTIDPLDSQEDNVQFKSEMSVHSEEKSQFHEKNIFDGLKGIFFVGVPVVIATFLSLWASTKISFSE